MKRLLQVLLAYSLAAVWLFVGGIMLIVAYLTNELILYIEMFAILLVGGYLLARYTKKIGL